LSTFTLFTEYALGLRCSPAFAAAQRFAMPSFSMADAITLRDYVRPAASDEDCIWEQPYDLLISLEKKRVLDFLVLLSRADPLVISPDRKKQFFHDVGRVIGINPKPNKRAALRSAAFEWMRSVLQKEISDDALRHEIGDLPDLNRLLRRLYEGRLSDRNR
jgi:hypothetical protein